MKLISSQILKLIKSSFKNYWKLHDYIWGKSGAFLLKQMIYRKDTESILNILWQKMSDFICECSVMEMVNNLKSDTTNIIYSIVTILKGINSLLACWYFKVALALCGNCLSSGISISCHFSLLPAFQSLLAPDGSQFCFQPVKTCQLKVVYCEPRSCLCRGHSLSFPDDFCLPPIHHFHRLF